MRADAGESPFHFRCGRKGVWGLGEESITRRKKALGGLATPPFARLERDRNAKNLCLLERKGQWHQQQGPPRGTVQGIFKKEVPRSHP